MEKITKKVISWIRENPTEFWILVGIIIVGAFCRLYKIDQYMTFLGDEGRDAIIVRRIFTELHPPLIGPGTSVGNMYLGPLYYYMMALPLLIAGFSPVGPAVMIAILGVATITFVWWTGRSWFNKTAGLISAGLYAISPVVIYYSRSSWNPNIMPFFALLSIYSIWKVWRENQFNWLIVLAASFAFVLQSHYLGILLIPTVLIFWVLTYLKARESKQAEVFIKKSIIGLITFLVLMSPLFIFDLRHNFMNAKLIYAFITQRQATVFDGPWSAILNTPRRLLLINTNLIGVKNGLVGVLTSAAVVGWVSYLFIENFIKHGNFKVKGEYWLLFSWTIFGLIGLALYNKSVYNHYFGFLFAAPFLLVGIVISKLLSTGVFGKILGGVLVVLLISVNLVANPLRSEPNRLLQRSINVSKIIEENSGGRPFNLAVIADTNYEDGYEYFLLKDNYPVVDIDSQIPGTITSQLFAVCELSPSLKCDPTHSAKAEVANFGWSKIDTSWEVEGVTIYRLVHSI
jgi:4-amino-4-deoxy-L-arabinose transferase-like glycosyltransferase